MSGRDNIDDANEMLADERATVRRLREQRDAAHAVSERYRNVLLYVRDRSACRLSVDAVTAALEPEAAA